MKTFPHDNKKTISLTEIAELAVEAGVTVDDEASSTKDAIFASQTLDVLRTLCADLGHGTKLNDASDIEYALESIRDESSGALIPEEIFEAYIEDYLRSSGEDGILKNDHPWLKIVIDFSEVKKEYQEVTIEGCVYWV